MQVLQEQSPALQRRHFLVTRDPASAVVSALAFSGAKRCFAEMHRFTHVGHMLEPFAGLDPYVTTSRRNVGRRSHSRVSKLLTNARKIQL